MKLAYATRSLGILLVVAALSWLFFYLLSSPIDILKPGLVIPGLQDSCKLAIDNEGRYHIWATNEADLYRMLGFVQAARQIDLMDRLLRAATGQLAAAYGTEALPADRLAHLVGFERLGRKTVAQLDTSTQALLAAYAEGINQVIRQHGREVSIMWRLKDIAPLEWDAARVVAVTRLYNWLLTTDWRLSILLAKIAAIYGDEKVRAGFPILEYFVSYPVDSTRRLLQALNQFSLESRCLESYLMPERERFPSIPFISNQLTPQAIIVRQNYLPWPEMIVGLHCPQFEAVGYLLPGMPFLLAGKTATHSWSVAWEKKPHLNLYFIATGSDARTYRWGGAEKPLQKIEYFLTNGGKGHIPADLWLAEGMPWIEISKTPRVGIGIDWAGSDYLDVQILLNLAKTTSLPSLLGTYVGASMPPLQLVWSDVNGGWSKLQSLGEEYRWHLEGTPLIRYGWQADSQMVFRGDECQLLSAARSDVQVQFVNAIPPCYQPQYEQAGAIWEACRPFLTGIENPLHPWAERLLTTWARQPVLYESGAVLWDFFLQELEEAIFYDELIVIDSCSWAQMRHWDVGKSANLARLLQEGSSSWFDDLTTGERVESIGTIVRRAWGATLAAVQDKYGPDTLNFQTAVMQFEWACESQNLWLSLLPARRLRPEYRCPTWSLQNLVLAQNERQLLFTRFIMQAPQLRWQVKTEAFPLQDATGRPQGRLINIKRRP